MPCVCEEHGNNVSFSTFCNLRPVNVLLSRSTPHDDMCSCQTHENFISLTKPLLPPYNRQWIVENSVCRFEEINVQLAKMTQRKLCARKARLW